MLYRHQFTSLLFSAECCIYFDSYIKPQLRSNIHCLDRVVYLLIPTSNHNLLAFSSVFWRLYIFWFLHQTTTITVSMVTEDGCISFDSYIKPQLPSYKDSAPASCISFDSYIKPQLTFPYSLLNVVVYLLIPTSNHNCNSQSVSLRFVVYLLIPTSNHNLSIFFTSSL